MQLNNKSLEQFVVDYMSKFPELRENIRRLHVNIWIKEIGGQVMLESMTASQFLKFYIENDKLSDACKISKVFYEIQRLGFLRGQNFNIGEDNE